MNRLSPVPIDIISRIALLERRLDDGYRLIEARRLAGHDIRDLEEFWIDLLHQYEDLCSGLAIAA